MPKKGFYIAFEGLFRAGKSEQSRRLYQSLKTLLAEREILLTYEPGGDPIANEIRHIVQEVQFPVGMSPLCEALLYAASRAQTIEKVVLPVLEKGGVVISDRCFLSSVAFQGYGRQLSPVQIVELNMMAIRSIVPDLIIYLDIPASVALSRHKSTVRDKFEEESIEFLQRVQMGYRDASIMPKIKEHWITIDGSKAIESVARQVYRCVTSHLN
jgi:dTMP kinase